MFYYNGFNATKQLVACSICLFSIRYIYKGNLLNFLIFVLLASMIHITAAIFIAC